jgi:hypothetical protein
MTATPRNWARARADLGLEEGLVFVKPGSLAYGSVFGNIPSNVDLRNKCAGMCCLIFS